VFIIAETQQKSNYKTPGKLKPDTMGFEEFSRLSNDFDHYNEVDKNNDGSVLDNKPTFFQNMVTNFGECGFSCIKTTFFAYNLLFFIVGFIVLFLAAFLHTTRDDITTDYTISSGIEGYINGPILLLGIGSVTLVLSFLACFGSRKNNLVILSLYLFFLLLITAAELGLIILVYTNRVLIENSLKIDFQKTLNHYSLSKSESITKAVDNLQQEFRCCGNDGYTDWLDTKWWQQNNGNYSVPTSCCIIPRMRDCNTHVEERLEMIFVDGCYDHVKQFLFENLHIISGFTVWIVVLEILGVVFSLALIIKIRKENKLRNDRYNTNDDTYNRTDSMDY